MNSAFSTNQCISTVHSLYGIDSQQENLRRKRIMTSEALRNLSTTTVVENEEFLPRNVPSILELKKNLPQHCFESHLPTSLYYVFKDLAIIAALYFAILLVDKELSNIPYLSFMAYPIYWNLQGMMFWALFVLGHDCGHGSFSRYEVLNDVVGNLLHAFILVPYYPWKLSHRHHHKNTGNIDRDEIFYPIRQKDWYKGNGEREGSTLPLFGLGLGWFFYLVVGYSPRNVNHLNPFDQFFNRNNLKCGISIALVAAWSLVLAMSYQYEVYTFFGLLKHYLIPLFVFASWLVITTFLHHQGEDVPWYSDEEWNFVRGNLSSVDRDYGWAHNLVHNIGTHQIHHLFIKIPHYHLEEATQVFRDKYPHLVRKCNDPILTSFVKRFFVFTSHQLISNETKFHFFDGKKSTASKKIS